MYESRPAGWPSHCELAVGWDPALETYFAQVRDYSIGRDDNCVIAWLGTLPPHYQDIDDLMQALNDRIRGVLPEVRLTGARRALLIRNRRIDYEGQAPFSTYPKSWAIPPLYVLRATARCPQCGRSQHVYTLGCAAFRHAEDRQPIDAFHFLRRVGRLPRRVLGMLKGRYPGFSLDREADGEPPYLMNHCRCGVLLDDDFVCGDVGAVFFPDTPDGYGEFELHRLPIDEPIPVECSTMLGGCEYLSFDQAEAW